MKFVNVSRPITLIRAHAVARWGRGTLKTFDFIVLYPYQTTVHACVEIVHAWKHMGSTWRVVRTKDEC